MTHLASCLTLTGRPCYSLEFTARQSAQFAQSAIQLLGQTSFDGIWNPPVCLLLAFRWQCVRGVLRICALQIYAYIYLLTYLNRSPFPRKLRATSGAAPDVTFKEVELEGVLSVRLHWSWTSKETWEASYRNYSEEVPHGIPVFPLSAQNLMQVISIMCELL